MGSSRRWAASSGSSCSSCSSSWQRYDERKGAAANARRSGQGAERLSVEDEREVARRVLEDLESLYFDGIGDGESEDEDEDEFDSSSEWGSEKSLRSSSGKRKAGGMTLEELTVALNAAIEYHRPATLKLSTPVQESKLEADERLDQSLGERHQRPRSRRQEEVASLASTPRGESSLEFFQDMLERKQRDFYAMKIAPEPDEEVIEDRQSQGTVPSNNAVTSTREKQTVTLVRDQATETEEYFQYPRFDASFGVADFQTPPHSPPRSVCLRSTQAANVLPVTIGPTLADLAASHRRRERDRLSSRSVPGPESSWSSSPSSFASHQRAQSDFSYASKRSEGSSSSSSSSSRTSSRASDMSSRNSRSSRSSRSSERSSQAESLISRASKSESQVSQIQKNYEPEQLVLEPPTQLNAYLPTPATEIQIDRASSNSPRIPSSPALVNWELDLSNFVL
ncbi:hypothetical protein PHYSODRAFT_302019 [Phytophthora sojae]|uniref:Uncharacterized protein n=1 Tax=Phytophthora sojae (strain P6497) TaxID=1094619 RepID=G4ZQJ2_PHYSP|nr:hypothetical protein PHYSODRAFT_302019 [Phytophthora sojae]EGZ15520.1 hypothetical protein PHYSODRAFT_302019 [Phytophthora sojae]|eukprot:XP_009529269.1 hypothetical protein PHYSODRAFT_302019 [Phytophthora sojae]